VAEHHQQEGLENDFGAAFVELELQEATQLLLELEDAQQFECARYLEELVLLLLLGEGAHLGRARAGPVRSLVADEPVYFDGRDDVDEEPGLQVVAGDAALVLLELALDVLLDREEVDEDVEDEYGGNEVVELLHALVVLEGGFGQFDRQKQEERADREEDGDVPLLLEVVRLEDDHLVRAFVVLEVQLQVQTAHAPVKEIQHVEFVHLVPLLRVSLLVDVVDPLYLQFLRQAPRHTCVYYNLPIAVISCGFL